MAGGREGQTERKELEWGEGPSLAITAMSCLEFAYEFRLSVSIASEHPFCVLIYMNSYIFHTYSILLLSRKKCIEYLFLHA